MDAWVRHRRLTEPITSIPCDLGDDGDSRAENRLFLARRLICVGQDFPQRLAAVDDLSTFAFWTLVFAHLAAREGRLLDLVHLHAAIGTGGIAHDSQRKTIPLINTDDTDLTGFGGGDFDGWIRPGQEPRAKSREPRANRQPLVVPIAAAETKNVILRFVIV
jgi:hypothetical protein